METTVKKREWVKDAAIIFLAVLLVLTFFSNTIMNRSLPEVATAAVGSGNIIAKVRGTGTVTATGKHQVKAKEIRTIRSVMVKVGQEVSTGDVLFVLGQGDETALEQAKDKLRTLQASYERAALNTPTLNYSSYNRAIESANNALNRAIDKRIEAETKLYDTSSDPITEAALRRYLDAEEYLRELEESYSNNREQEYQRLTEQIEMKKSLRDELKNSPEFYDYDNAYNNYYNIAQPNVDYWASEVERARDNYSMISQIDEPLEGEQYDRKAAYDDLITAQNEYENAKADAAYAKDEMDRLADGVSTILQEISTLESEISSLESERDSLANDDSHYEKVKAAMAKRDTYYNEYSILAGNLESDYLDALYAEEDARIALQAAYDDLAYAQERNSIDVASTGVDLQEIAEQIEVQQEKIKSLAGDEENVITANVSGVIDTIDCTAGDTVNKDALLCTIEVPDMGHTLSFSVTNDQAQRLRIGDTATIPNYYWGNSVTATLTTIRTDPKNPQTNKVLTFDLEGDVTSGAEMTISVGQKSANYDIIVPNSAIKSDNNGSFVLAVQVKSSPLGNRYTAKRVSVEVLANDDNNSAVVADLNNGDYVITTSSSPVSSGDMVRIADNQT